MLAAIERGDTADELRRWFTAVVSDHLLSYGHGAIYAQKAFELLAMIGWERAATVLPHLVPTLVYGTREDKLPYMRPFVRGLDSLDLAALATVPAVDGWTDDGTLRSTLLGSDRRAALDATVAALRDGAGIDGVLDTVVHVVSDRMLRYDTAGEFDFADDFGWLDITHGLTYASAARWHHDQAMSRDAGTTPDLVRLALYTAFLAQWTGRHEWHTRVGEEHDVEPLAPDLDAYGRELQRASLLDGTSAFIVHAHAVKTSRAASVEAARLDSVRPLDATARFMAAPKLERFVAATVERSIDFLERSHAARLTSRQSVVGSSDSGDRSARAVSAASLVVASAMIALACSICSVVPTRRSRRACPTSLEQLGAHVARAIGRRDLAPRRSGAVALFLLVVGEHRAPPVGQLELELAAHLGGGDRPAIFELAQRRIDGARTRAPAALAAGLEFGDQLVAVHRTLGQQGQDRRRDGASLGPVASAAASAPVMRPAAVVFGVVEMSVMHGACSSA